MLARDEAWPPDYSARIVERHRRWQKLSDPEMLDSALAWYGRQGARGVIDFIDHWCDTWDPRNASQGLPVRMPFVLFRRQRELVAFLHSLIMDEQPGLVEKSRDMGATWVACAFSVWIWRFLPGASIGWGSRKAMLVDSSGNMDSIFEKMRALIRGLPRVLRPSGFDPDAHMSHMKIVNPETDTSITGESGDEIGRGGRKLAYFKDESAHYERPELIEAALADNTRVQIDISSVRGLGNVFHRRREAGMDWEPGIEIPRGITRVFVMDWRDHPAKSQQWYDERKQKFTSEGLGHVFAQEVDRNYASSVENVIIPHEWVESAIDADERLGVTMDDGGWCGALDVADNDGGGDRNAMAKRKGVKLRYLDEWGERDTGVTTRRAIGGCEDTLPMELWYDCIGVGSGVKAEYNRLVDDELMPGELELRAWDAGAGPVSPDQHVLRLDDGSQDVNSPLNKDFYANLKAQGWWELRLRFWRTHQCVEAGRLLYSVDDLICIPSTLPRLRQLQKELSQPTAGKSTRLKLVVNKAPSGTRSPNLGDVTMMCYWPAEERSRYDASLAWVR